MRMAVSRNQNEEIFYNALAIAAEGNYRRLSKLRERFGGWEAAWRRSPETAPEAEEPGAAWQALQNLGIRLILFDDPLYPPLLKEISWPPFGIYALGNFDGLTKPAIAIVGTRRATEAGKATAKHFARELGGAGLTIVSGMALGIDAAAHEGTLEAGGKTVAVLGNGLDRFYPRFNEGLAKRILGSGGAIISEYPAGTPSLPRRFLERNRIISGLSAGTLVVEAPEESGALVTARFAAEQNREVFIVPGPHNHPNFHGSHRLIRGGAELVTNPLEILESFQLDYAATLKDKLPLSESKEERLILEALRRAGRPLDVDKIIELTNLEARTVSQTASFLLVKNRIREDGGGYTTA